MKNQRAGKNGLVIRAVLMMAALLAAALGQPATAGDAQPPAASENASMSGLPWRAGKAVVRALRNGHATCSLDGVKWERLKIGQRLPEGAAIKTDKTCVVDLFLGANGPVVRVTPDSQLVLKKLQFAQTEDETVIWTDLDLVAGRILAAVKKLAAASRYQVTTPRGVTLLVKGTQFDISTRERVRISVVEGTVVALVKGADGQEQKYEVPRGYSFESASGGEPARVFATPADAQNDTQSSMSEADFVAHCTGELEKLIAREGANQHE